MALIATYFRAVYLNDKEIEILTNLRLDVQDLFYTEREP